MMFGAILVASSPIDSEAAVAATGVAVLVAVAGTGGAFQWMRIARRHDYELEHQLREEGTPAASTAALLAKHYDQGERQGHWSFFITMCAAIVGFVVILLGVVYLVVGQGATSQVLISESAGIILEGFAALFMKLNNAARKRVGENLDRLRADNASELEVAVMERIRDKRLRDRVRATYALGGDKRHELVSEVLNLFQLGAGEQTIEDDEGKEGGDGNSAPI